VRSRLPHNQLIAGAVVLSAVLVGAQRVPNTVAFVGVTVVPMDRERMLADQTVIVGNGTITEIGPSTRVAVPPPLRRASMAGANT
jgi:hypothetical protein